MCTRNHMFGNIERLAHSMLWLCECSCCLVADPTRYALWDACFNMPTALAKMLQHAACMNAV